MGIHRPIKAAAKFLCHEFGYELADIFNRKRTRPMVNIRHVVILILRQNIVDYQGKPVSFPRMAKALGYMDHTTLIHAIKRAQQILQTDGVMRARATWAAQELKAWDYNLTQTTNDQPITPIIVLTPAQDTILKLMQSMARDGVFSRSMNSLAFASGMRMRDVIETVKILAQYKVICAHGLGGDYLVDRNQIDVERIGNNEHLSDVASVG